MWRNNALFFVLPLLTLSFQVKGISKYFRPWEGWIGFLWSQGQWILGEVHSVPENWVLTKKILSKMAGEKKTQTKTRINSTEKNGRSWFLAGFELVLNIVVKKRKRRRMPRILVLLCLHKNVFLCCPGHVVWWVGVLFLSLKGSWFNS